MSTTNGPDPIDRLRAADPVRADDLPDASLARITATVQEHIMSDKQFDPTVRPTRGPLAIFGGIALAGAFALAIAVSSGFGLDTGSPDPIGAVPTPTEDPVAGGGAAGGGAAGGGVASCIMYDPATLPSYDIVFDGTVTAIDGDQITFDVNTGWRGVDRSVTLTAPEAQIALTGPLPDFEVGGRYLVTAFESTINSCGYTLDYDAESAADWAAAFGA